MAGPQSQTTSLQRLHRVDERIVRLLELAGSVMDELASSTGSRMETLANHCREFMQSIKRIVRLLELAGSVMDELASSTGFRMETLANHCREFMQSIKDIQMTLREEIKSACDYRPFEKCDYNARISNEICCMKLEYIIERLDGMKQTTDQYKGGA